MNAVQIDRLIGRRERLTNRRDGLTDSKRIAKIDAQLATVEPGRDNRVDKLLGRPCATLEPRAEYQRWSSDADRREWHDAAATQTAEAASAMQDEFLIHAADQYEDMLDFLRICGDLAL